MSKKRIWRAAGLGTATALALAPSVASAAPTTPGGPLLYVVASNFVEVVDTGTNTVVNQIQVAPSSDLVDGLAVSPDGATIYTSDFNAGTVSAFSAATGAVEATVTLPSPNVMVISPDGTTLYVETSDGVAVIDTATNEVTTTVPGVQAHHLAVSPNGATVYAAGDGVTPISTSTNTAGATITGVGRYVAAGPFGRAIYSFGNASGHPVLEMLSAATGQIVGTVPLKMLGQAQSFAVSPNGAYVYVNGDSTARENGAGNIAVVSTKTHRVVQTIRQTGLTSQFIAISPDGSQAYTTSNPLSLADVDLATGSVTRIPLLQNGPTFLSFAGS